MSENGYCILQYSDRNTLSKAVSEKQTAGWVCAGGVTISFNDSGNIIYYMQAMVLPDDEFE